MNIASVKALCLSSSLQRRHSSTTPFTLCSLPNAHICLCAQSAPFRQRGARHRARHRCRLIRHVILPRKSPANIAMSISRYGEETPHSGRSEVGRVDFKYMPSLSLFHYCLLLSTHSLITHFSAHSFVSLLTQTVFTFVLTTHLRQSLLLYLDSQWLPPTGACFSA